MNNKNKQKKIILLIGRITLFLFIASLIFLTTNVIKLNILPTKFMILFIVIELLFSSIMFLMLYIKGVNRKVKIAFIVIAVLAIVGIIYTTKYFDSTLSFFKTITDDDKVTANYYVMVLNDDKYNDIKDLTNKNIGINLEDEELLKRLSSAVDINKEINDSIKDMANKLLKGKLDAILVAEYQKLLLDENLKDFTAKTKILYTISIETSKNIASNKVDVTTESFNVYISGIDTYGGISTVSRSDVNIIATVNPNTNEVLLTTIPRDYEVTLRGIKEYDKLTHAGMYGVETSTGTIEDLLNIKINYYVRVNFSTLTDVVDALGGVSVKSDYDFGTYGGCKFKKGTNNLDGKCALEFSRERHAFDMIGGDRQRGKNQLKVVTGIIDKATSPAIINKYTSLLKSLEGTFNTNFETKDIQSLVRYQIDRNPKWNISTYALNGRDSKAYLYSYPNEKLFVMTADIDTVNKASKYINGIMAGNKVDIDKDIILPNPTNQNAPAKKDVKEDVSTVKSNEEIDETSIVKENDKIDEASNTNDDNQIEEATNNLEDKLDNNVVNSNDDLPSVKEENVNSKETNYNNQKDNENIEGNKSVNDNNEDIEESIKDDVSENEIKTIIQEDNEGANVNSNSTEENNKETLLDRE